MFQTISEIGTAYHISAIKAGRVLYELGIRDRDHPVQKGFPFEQYITHGIALPVKNSKGEIRYFKYNIDTIRDEFEALAAGDTIKEMQHSTARDSILNQLSHTLVRVDILLETLPIPQLRSIRTDIAEICTLLETANTHEEKAQPLRLDADSKQLLEHLKAWRRALSQEQELPAYMIASNAVLEQIAIDRPEDMDELMEIKGIGEKKAQSYGTALLKQVSAFHDDSKKISSR